MTTYRFSTRLWRLLPSEILQEDWPLAQTIMSASDVLQNERLTDGSDLDLINFLCNSNATELIMDKLEQPMRSTLLALVGRDVELWAVYNETNRNLWKD